jgi:two-component system, NtrC family, response regulator AtoC
LVLKQISIPVVENLAESSISFELFIDDLPFGILVVDLDRKIILANRAFEALTGFSKKEISGVFCSHILRSRHCVKNCPVLKMDDSSEPVCNESDIINKDRQLIPIHSNVATIKDLDGQVIGYIETIEDLRAIRELDTQIRQAFTFAHLIGHSPQMERIFKIIPVVAQSGSSVLITGETGTGKDMVAEAIHQASNRSKGTFVKINCGALPENLLESELFGHKKGSFTGAIENKPGRFKLAHNGTLYLTEIGDLPLVLQVKLLTFLDDHIIYPIGSTKGFQADVRIIAGTHRNLEQMVKKGEFREDLLFRLNVVRIQLPPLRERENDMRLLADHFLNSLNTKLNKSINGFSNSALSTLNNYPFPGNVRELRNIIEYAMNICPRERIEVDHLPAYLLGVDPAFEEPLSVGLPELPDSRPDPNVHEPESQHRTWSEMERDMILDALSKAQGRREKAAEILGWGRSTLWRKIKKYQIS